MTSKNHPWGNSCIPTKQTYNGIWFDDFENRLRELRLSFGLSLKKMADVLGISRPTLSRVELGYTSPLDHDGVKPWVAKACQLFNEKFEDVFPREVCALGGRGDFVFDQVQSFLGQYKPLSPESILQIREFFNVVTTVASRSRFSPNEKRAVLPVLKRIIFGGTLNDLGNDLGVSQERARQLESKVLRALRADKLTRDCARDFLSFGALALVSSRDGRRFSA